MDKIIISGLRVFARHGVLPFEKEIGQPFLLDMVLYADLSSACRTDALEDTINYDLACTVASKAMTDNAYDLIERAAQAVCDALMSEFPQLLSVELTIRKPRAPLTSDVDYVAVSISRNRENII